MLLEGLMSLIFGIVYILLLPFQNINIALDSSFLSTVQEYLKVIFYILPIQNFIPILVFIIALMSLRILISVLKTLWSILPFI